MIVDDDLAAILARINKGEMVVDIGQLSRVIVRALNRLANRGQLIRGECTNFPAPKRCWIGAYYGNPECDDPWPEGFNG